MIDDFYRKNQIKSVENLMNWWTKKFIKNIYEFLYILFSRTQNCTNKFLLTLSMIQMNLSSLMIWNKIAIQVDFNLAYPLTFSVSDMVDLVNLLVEVYTFM